MCLLIVLAGIREDLPLVVAANRDELYARASDPMAVLRAAAPRIIGGRDHTAGGTWLAVNEHGVVAGVTNPPTPQGRDATKQSRGELPLLCATQTTARAAATTLASHVKPTDYNPASMLIADTTEAFGVDLAGSTPEITGLGTGVHLLENRALGATSSKLDRVRALLGDVHRCDAATLIQGLHYALSDHKVPEGPSAAEEAGRSGIPREVGAACVQTERYGTRWSAIITVATGEHITFHFANGAPCETPFQDAGALLRAEMPHT